MKGTVLDKGYLSLRYGLLKSTVPYNNQSIRSLSLNSAIGKGLRKSKGVGFRGNDQKDQRRETFEEKLSGGFRDRVREIDGRKLNNRPNSPSSREGWRNSHKDDYNPRRGERSPDYESWSGNGSRNKFTAKSDDYSPRSGDRFRNQDSPFDNGSRNKSTRDRPSSMHSKGFGKPSRSDRVPDRQWMEQRPGGGRHSPGRLAFLEKTKPIRGMQSDDLPSLRPGEYDELQNSQSDRSKFPSRDGFKRSNRFDQQDDGVKSLGRSQREDYGNDRQYSEDGFGRTGNKSAARHGKDQEKADNESPIFGSLPDKRVPLSIPYTTPASEFLYGTSVVEAALTSKKEPRRKLYKLYIHAGENRENEARDRSIEQLAKDSRVEVVHVNTEWLRLMDKMSGGRPHNGYVLEASPLPKLPVISLGHVHVENGLQGMRSFPVVLDYQSREEAAINGTSNSVEIPQDSAGRKPLVLFLDSIQDPGNLGGIIRSASFLGVNAIAISTRNSASFTPVVMKASAGALEQVTILSVNKPLAFLENSKSAGWNIYAAVPPSSHPKHNDPPSITTDELSDPLLNDPCILMLGNEGEGLRWNLRSRADYDLSIPGAKHPNAVNSLNVSVAAGILCSAFFRKRHGSTLNTEENLEQNLRPQRDLF